MKPVAFARSLTRSLVAAALGTALASASVTTQAATFSSLFVFGDSLSDNGNNGVLFGGTSAQLPTSNIYVPAGAPYASGTYSNGAVWISGFAAGIGLPASAVASLKGGGDFAFGGARTSADGAGLPPSMASQVGGFLAGVSALPANALVVLEAGGNDVRDVVTQIVGGAPVTATIATAAASYAVSVGNMVDALQAKGATRIVVWDAPDIGTTPAALTLGFSALASSVATAFNSQLALRLAGESGVSIFDVYGVVDTVSANKGAYGLTNVTDACGAIAGCDPSKYLFWDGIHPTSAGHAILTNAMLAAVPEPASTLLFAIGGAGLVAALRRRRTAAA